MAALPIIEHFDVFKYCCLGRLVCGIILQIDQCGFSGMEEALGYGIVPTVALPTHTGLYRILGQELSIAVGAILTPTIGMHDEPRGGLPLIERHR